MGTYWSVALRGRQFHADFAVNVFPFLSELMNKLVVYKTQDASLVEGGLAGPVSLETLKPLDC